MRCTRAWIEICMKCGNKRLYFLYIYIYNFHYLYILRWGLAIIVWRIPLPPAAATGAQMWSWSLNARVVLPWLNSIICSLPVRNTFFYISSGFPSFCFLNSCSCYIILVFIYPFNVVCLFVRLILWLPFFRSLFISGKNVLSPWLTEIVRWPIFHASVYLFSCLLIHSVLLLYTFFILFVYIHYICS